MDQGNGSATYPTNFAPSVHSSRMTDAASEDADEYYPEGAAAKKARRKTEKRSVAGSSRPVSPPASYYSGRSGTRRRFGGPGVSMANSSRVEALYNRNSLTHAPSITSHAFFRPMSSQRLQAQRTPRPNTGTQASSRLSSASADRPSMESNQTATPTTPKLRDITAPPSLSGSEFAEADPPGHTTLHSTRPRDDTLQSTTESTRPLQANMPQSDFDSKDPSAFRPHLSYPSKRSPVPRQTQLGNGASYANDTNSPHISQKVPSKPSVAGKNYEYFSGNTAFCWGGRIQNSRDRPINIITGIILIVPMVLFFVFE